MTAPAGDRQDEVTESRVAQLVRFVARVTLEAERGLRPARHLEPLLHPSIARLWIQRRPAQDLTSGPVVDRDIGPAHVTFPAPDRVLANVTLHTGAGRFAALSMELRQRRSRWVVTSLTRLYRRRNYHAVVAADEPVFQTLMDQAIQIQQVRATAASALQACTTRLRELPADTSAAHRSEIARQVARWSALVRTHDTELAQLYRRLAVQHAVRSPAQAQARSR